MRGQRISSLFNITSRFKWHLTGSLNTPRCLKSSRFQPPEGGIVPGHRSPALLSSTQQIQQRGWNRRPQKGHLGAEILQFLICRPASQSSAALSKLCCFLLPFAPGGITKPRGFAFFFSPLPAAGVSVRRSARLQNITRFSGCECREVWKQVSDGSSCSSSFPSILLRSYMKKCQLCAARIRNSP